MRNILLVLLIIFSSLVHAQNAHNYVFINATDTKQDIISKAAHVRPSPKQLSWQQLELTGMISFGMNTFTNNEWGTGKEDPKLFNPISLDAMQWVRICKQAGIKQILLIAKHHDGFCLWPSKYTEHSVKNSLWKNGKGDVVKEVADACHQRVEKFELDYWDGNNWKKAIEGTTIGYKRLLRFPTVTADRVRLTIESSRLNPTIATMGLYKQPQDMGLLQANI